MASQVEVKNTEKKMRKGKDKEKEEPKLCPVCMDHFTPIIRQPIQCAFCPHATCRQCCSRYLLTTLNDPHCMECKREWNREFIDINLTQTFRKGPLRQHRRKVLIDREKGRLPAMQSFVEAQKTMEECTNRIVEIMRTRKGLKRQRAEIQIQYGRTDTIQQMEERLRPINIRLAELKTERRARENAMWTARAIITGQTRPEVRQFIMKCPGEECRGFLSNAWKCGTCQKFFCHECHAEKTGVKDEEHVCKEDAKATASLIRQETRACPKCGIRISKIEGCDQMWCVSCHTTFSWNTGQVLLNTVVHNPHYYEYLRSRNNGVVPREAGDVPCGGLPQAYWFTRTVMETPGLSPQERTEILDCLRCLSDIQYVRLPNYPLRPNANVNQAADIRYLMNQVTEEEWGTTLERTETTGERKKEIGLILQTLLHVGSEKYTAVQNNENRVQRTKLLKDLIVEMRQVLEYTNKSLWQKGLQMDIVVPQITNEWRWSMAKKGTMKQAKKTKGKQTIVEAPGGNQVVMPTQEAVEEPIATSDTPAVLSPSATESPSYTEANSEEENDLVELELPDGERVRMSADQAREIMGAR